MANIQLKITALGDFSSVNAQLKALQTQVQTLQKSIAGVGLSSDLTGQLKNIQTEFGNALVSSGNFTKQTVQLTSETEKFGQALQAGKLKLGDYFGIITGRSAAAQKSVQALAVEQVKLNNSIVQQDITKQGVYSVYTPTTINATAKAVELAAAKQNIFNIAVQQGSQKLIDFGKNTQWAGRQLTVGLSMPALLFGSQAVAAFKAVNTELTRLQRLYGEGLTPPSQAEINAISQQVLNLGSQVARQMGIAQSETTKVAANFAAMGIQGQKLLDVTYQAQRLSKLGAVDASQATNTVVALQNVYRVSTQDLGNAVNFLSSMQKQTTMTLQDMTEAIPRVGPIMQQLGGGYKDTAVMLLAMREAGVPAAQAANALKSAFASLIAPTKAATTEAKSFGISLDSIKNAGTPIQMIEKLQEGLKGLAPLAREQIIEKIFGKFQFARISALLDNLGRVGSQTQNALKVAGATNAQLAELANQEMTQATQSTTAKWQRAVEGLKASLYPIGQEILKVGSQILSFGQKIADFFNKLPGPIKSGLGILLTLGVIAGPIIMITGLLANLMGQGMKVGYALLGMIDGTKKWKDLMTPAGIAAKTATDAFQTGLLENVTAVDTLNAALQRLITSLEAINMNFSATTGTSLIGKIESVAATKLASGQMILPGFSEGGTVPGTGNEDSVPAMLTPGEIVVPKHIINKIRTNDPTATMKLFGLINPGGGSGFQSNPGGTLLPSFTVSTPRGPGAGSFNTQLAAGTASGEDWTKWAEESGRGAESHTGLMALMRASGIDESKIQEVGKKVQSLFAEKIRKYAGNLSDAIFSREAFSTYDKVISEEFAGNQKMLDAYQNEKSVVGSVRTPVIPRPKKPGSVSGGSLRNIYSPERKIPYFANLRGEGRTESHIFPPEFVAQMQTEQALSAGVSVERTSAEATKRLDVSARESLQEHSPSVKGEETGKDYISGLQKGVKEQAPQLWTEGKQVVSNLHEGIDQGLNGAEGQSKIQGIFSKTFGAEGKLSKIMSKFSNMGNIGKMGIGFAVSAAGQLASPLLSKIPGVGGAMSAGVGDASSAFGLAMSNPITSGFAPEIAAAAGAFGLLKSGITSLIAMEKEHAAEAKADFTSSADAVQILGGKVVDTTSHLKDLNIILNAPTTGTVSAAKVLGANISYTNQQLDSFSSMVKSLPKDNALALIIKQVKDAGDSGSAAKIASEFATLQMAINNINPTQAKQLEQLILTVGGKDAGAAKTPVSNQLDAMKSSLNSALPNSKQFAQVIGQITSAALNANSLDSVNMAIKAVGASSASAQQQVAGLLQYFTLLGNNNAVKLLTSMQNMGGFNYSDISKTLLAYQNGANISLGTLKNDLKSGGSIDQAIAKSMTDRANKTKELNALQAQLTKLTNGSSAATAANTAATQNNVSGLTKQQKLLDANLKALQDLQKQQTQNTNYATTKEDLKNQILMAQATGDNLKAQLLQQQLLSTTKDFNLQNKIDAAQQAADRNRVALDTANAAVTIAQTNAQNSNTKAINDLTLKIQQKQNALDNPTAGSIDIASARPSTTMSASEIKSKMGTRTTDPVTGKTYTLMNVNGQVGWYGSNNDLIQVKTKAYGGHITGPGSSTSDSIPAMLSNGEYVINASAVSHYGKGTFDALNSMHLAKGGVARTNSSITYHRQHMNRISRHFATGGYVPSAVSSLLSMPSVGHYALGGLATPAGGNVVYNVNVNVDKIDSTVDMTKAINDAMARVEAKAKMSGLTSRVGM